MQIQATKKPAKRAGGLGGQVGFAIDTPAASSFDELEEDWLDDWQNIMTCNGRAAEAALLSVSRECTGFKEV